MLLAALAVMSLLAVRSCGRSPLSEDTTAPENVPPVETDGQAAGEARRETAARAAPEVDHPATAEPVDHRPHETAVDSSTTELPIWERPPRTTAQPFPEAARFDPPFPPFKLPPEMLRGAVDAGAASD